MTLSPMRYKDYIWDYNPKVYGVTYRRHIAALKIPRGGCVMQDLGKSYRILRGEGEFTGEKAYDNFKKLAQVFEEGGSGTLVHPVWQLTKAFFVSLTLKQEPRENYVAYTFEFWEDVSSGSVFEKVSSGADESAQTDSNVQTGERYYTVVKGDTLWGIARDNGMTLSELIAKNPQIKNPNLIYPGDKIKL